LFTADQFQAKLLQFKCIVPLYVPLSLQTIISQAN